jgi:hypothetical protein
MRDGFSSTTRKREITTRLVFMPLNKVDLSLLFVVVEKTPLSYKIIKAYNTPKLDKRVRFLNVAAEFLNA